MAVGVSSEEPCRCTTISSAAPIEARERADGLHRDSRLIQDLARRLREAHAGQVSIRRCAWCERLEIGGEWLHLEAVGTGQQRITASLLETATHGICADCLARQLERSRSARGG